jgi:hypothetical protein
MQKKILAIIICILLSSTFAGAINSNSTTIKSENKKSENLAPTHTILAEFGTTIPCLYCKYSHDALMHLFFKYQSEWQKYPFYYITHIWDRNYWANSRCKNELGMVATPSVYWDAGWRKNDKPGISSTEIALERYRKSIRIVTNRSVADIDLSVDGTWLGAVNPEPEDDATNVDILQKLNWTNTEMIVNVSVTNNEGSSYNGHLHVCVCDNQSAYWYYDTNDTLYSMVFLDYAFNQNLALGTGETWTSSKNWDGMDHTNGSACFFNSTQDNTWVVASIFDRDNDDYADETAGYRLGEGTDPKYYTVYFGTTDPPALKIENISIIQYDPEGLLFNTTYYWRVDVWDQKGSQKKGEVWDFTTRVNHPPNPPYGQQPGNESENIPIKVNFSWRCEDPDGDNMTYDVYLGEYNPPSHNFTLIADNISTTWYELNRAQLLKFSTWYEWYVVAKDDPWDWKYGNYNTSSPYWIFKTEENAPPNKAKDPFPPDNAENILTNVTLRWYGSDPNYGDPLEYDLYFGVSPDPELKKSNLKDNFTKPPYDLVENNDYYWKILTRDRDGLETMSDEWKFNTGRNDPPEVISIQGDDKVKPNEEHKYTFIATDRENDSVSYHIDWGDGNITDWTPWQDPGSPGYTEGHSWAEKGTYTITCKAKDMQRVGQPKTFRVSVPKNKVLFVNPFLHKLLDIYPNLFPLLRFILGL